MPYSQEEFAEYISSDIAQVGAAPEVSNSIESKARRAMAIAGPFIPIGGIALAAKYGFKERLSGGRVWDVYYNFLKQLEGGLPYGIFSTFHTSEIISPFAAPSQYALSPDKFGKLYKNIEFKNYLSRTTGVSFGALQKAGAFDKGIEWRRTGKVLGELSVIGGPTLAKDIGLLSTGTRRSGHILEWYARIQGATAPNFLKAFQEGFGQLRPEFLPIGSMGRGPASLAADYLYSLFSSSVGRLNLLLNSPLDLEATKDLARKVPFLGRLNLGVKPGTGLQMLGRYTGKAAVAFAGIHALGFTDFLAGGGSDEGLSRLGFLRGPLVGGILGAGAGFGIGLKSLGGVGKLPLRGFVIGAGLGLLTPFRDGPISGLAGSYAWLRVAQASISKGLGLSEGARRTEDYFEGATSPKTLVGMAGAGLLLGGAKDYFRNLAAARTVSALRGKVAAGKVARGVYEIAEKALTSEKELYYQLHTSKMGGADSAIVRTIESAKARFFGGRMDRAGNFRAAGAGRWAAVGAGGYSILSAGLSLLAGDVTGGLVQGAAGVAAAGLYLKGKGSAGVAALLAVPFLLREKEDPEYLKRVYSGEEKVEVKAGRAWEIGRSPYEGKRPRYREHRVAMMRAKSQEAALYGSEGEYWKTSPLLFPGRFLLNPYERDEMLWDQGWKFPVTKVPFEDFPILGPLLASTVGSIIKPPKLQGEEEWQRSSGRILPGGHRELPSADPVLRTSAHGVMGELFYNISELCLAGETLISLPDGTQKPIQEIEIGEFVETSKGQRKVVNKFSHKLCLEEDLREIKVQGISSPIRVTFGHQVYGMQIKACHKKGPGVLCLPNGSKTARHCRTCKKNHHLSYKPEWISAGELNKGDYWVRVLASANEDLLEISTLDYLPELSEDSPYSYEEEGDKLVRVTKADILNRKAACYFNRNKTLINRLGSKPYTITRRKAVQLPKKIVLDFDFGWLCGYTLAEGHQRRYDISWGGNISEKDMMFARLNRILKERFNLDIKVSRKYKAGREETNGIEAVVCSIDFANLIRGLLYTGGEKLLDSSLALANRSFLLGVLNGFIDGDFHVREGEITTGLSSCNLTRQLRDIFNRCGIYASLYFRKLPVKGKWFDNWALSVSTSGARKLLQGPFLGEKLSSQKFGETNTERNFVEFKDDEVYIFHRIVSNDRTGIEGISVFDIEVEDKHTYFANDLLVHNSGLPGFTTQSITQSLIGTKTPYTRPQLASASLVGGVEPSWWSLDLGGMGLLSESLRRYIPVRRSEIEYRNPLPSDLPSWLPGEDYIFDFSRADIYTKIDEPWARLPGSGFAALNPEVKGIDPENYSPYWRFKILADLAPYSKEYGRYEELMSRYAAENRLTAEERLEIERTRAQVSRVKKEHDFNAYAYDNQAVQRRRVTVTGVAEDGGFYTDSFGSAKVSLEGVSTARTTIAASLMRKDASLTASQALSGAVRKRAQVSDFLNQYIYPGAQLDLFIHRDPSLLMERGPAGEPTIKAIASDLSRGGSNINRALMESGLGDPFSDGRSLKPTMATNWLQRNAGSFFENLMHGMETPLESFIPLAPVAKFIHQRNPLEEYERSRVYAREVSLWEKPVSHFLAPGLRTTAWWLGWRGVPGEVRARYMVEEYFDRLQYMKAKNLETAAIMQGSGGAASEASMQARRTMTGANRYSPLSARLSIPIQERAYFDEFVRAPTGAERARINQIVSPQMSELLRAQWYRNSVAGSQLRAEAGIGTARDMMAIGTYNDVIDNEAISRDSRAAAAMTNVPVPGPRWLGWNQGADIQDVKIKTILDADMDLTAFGIWDSDLRRVARRPDIKPIRIEFQSNTYDRPSSFSFDDTFRRATGVQSMSGFRTGISASPGNRFEIRDPGYSRMDRLLRDPTITTF